MRKKNYTIHKLPELPIESLGLGGTLQQADFEPTLTIRPNHNRPPPLIPQPDPVPVPHCPSSASAFSRKYLTQVTYPKVTCYPLNAPTDQVIKRVFKQRRKKSKKPPCTVYFSSQRMEFFKLSRLNGNKLKIPHFCTIHSGPWSASVIEKQSCRVGCGVPPNFWRLSVSGFPELELQWYGTWQDVPGYIHPTMTLLMNDLHLLSTSWECCPGFKNCRGNCIPERSKCRDGVAV